MRTDTRLKCRMSGSTVLCCIFLTSGKDFQPKTTQERFCLWELTGDANLVLMLESSASNHPERLPSFSPNACSHHWKILSLEYWHIELPLRCFSMNFHFQSLHLISIRSLRRQLELKPLPQLITHECQPFNYNIQ